MSNISTLEIGFEIISFEHYYELNLFKIICYIISVLSSLITIPLIYGIIWFEENNHFTTLINKFVASICWYQIIFIVIVNVTTAIHYIKGPANNFICSFELVVQNVGAMQAFFLLDAIVVTKYIFVHLIKNAVAIDEGFFRYFINISTLSLSLISQLIFIWMPGRNPIGYYICLGNFPVPKSSIPVPVKVNTPLLALLALSGCIHIYTGIKRRQAKLAIVPNVEIVTEQRNSIFNVLTDKDMLANYTSNIISLVWISVGGVVAYLLNKTKPQDLSKYPNYLVLLFWTMAMPQILSYGTIIIYYSHHKNLRKNVLKEVKAFILRGPFMNETPVVDLTL